jgi:hypothetical protein
MACIPVYTAVVGIIAFACAGKCVKTCIAFEAANARNAEIFSIFDVAGFPGFAAIIDIVRFTRITVQMVIDIAKTAALALCNTHIVYAAAGCTCCWLTAWYERFA